MDLLRRGGGGGMRRSRPRSMTDEHRERSVSFFIGTALLISGATGLAVGAIAWRIPAPTPVKVAAAVPVGLPDNSIFDSGVTLFAAVPDHRNPPVPRGFGCRVSAVGDPPTGAVDRPVPEFVGSRVVDGAALTGVINLGHPAGGAQLVCDGPAARASSSLWVLPSQDGPSDQPLAIVVAGLFLLGVGALVHPRTRSI